MGIGLLLLGALIGFLGLREVIVGARVGRWPVTRGRVEKWAYVKRVGSTRFASAAWSPEVTYSYTVVDKVIQSRTHLAPDFFRGDLMVQTSWTATTSMLVYAVRSDP